MPLASSVDDDMLATACTIFGSTYTAINSIMNQKPIPISVVTATDSSVGTVCSVTNDTTTDRIASPSTSSSTAALTKIFPSFDFSFPISSKTVTATTMLVALNIVPTSRAVIQSYPIHKVTKYPNASGTTTPRIPTTADLKPALIRSWNVKCSPAENKMMIPEICHSDIMTSFSSTIGLPCSGTMPPRANGPSMIPAATNPIISEILKCAHSFPSSNAGKTRNKMPMIVGITSNSDTID